MAWVEHSPEDNEYSNRKKVFPRAVVTPEFSTTEWDPAGIQIGGLPGYLDVNFCYNTMCGHFGLSQLLAENIGEPYGIRRK